MSKKSKADFGKFLNKNSQPKPKEENTEFPIKMISVYDLTPNPLNNYPMEGIDEIAAELEIQGGIKQNFEVKEIAGGKYMLVSGHRRTLAIKKLLAEKSPAIQTDKVPCIVRTYASEDEEVKAIIFANRGHRKPTPSIELMELEALRPILQKEFKEKKARGEVTGRFRRYLAEQLNISETQVQRIESRAKLDEQIRADMDAGKITPTAAAELAGMSAEDQRAVYEKAERATVKDIKEVKRQTTQKPEPQKDKPQSPQVEMSETEQRIFGLIAVLDTIKAELAKIPKNSDIAHAEARDMWEKLQKAVEQRLQALSGENMFEEEENARDKV